jgi:hypothetical protein
LQITPGGIDMEKFKNWLTDVGIKVAKTMAEAGLGVIGTNAIRVTDVDWVGVGSTMLLSCFVTVLFNIKKL